MMIHEMKSRDPCFNAGMWHIRAERDDRAISKFHANVLRKSTEAVEGYSADSLRRPFGYAS